MYPIYKIITSLIACLYIDFKCR